MCLNHQIFEMLCMVDSISATPTVKELNDTEYRISSVDGNTYRITLFANKLWDLILLKLTEVVFYESNKNSLSLSKPRGLKWHKEKRDKDEYEEDAEDRKEWRIYLSVKTIAECLGLTSTPDALVHLYDRVVAATNVLRNIDIRVSIKGKHYKEATRRIDGYIDFVGVRDYSDTKAHYLTKSNAFFCFSLNRRLIDYIADQNPGFYQFNHCLFCLPEHSQNAYAAAKRLGRHYSQNTYKRRKIKYVAAVMCIGTLRNYLPSLNNKVERDNRIALDNALKLIPDAQYTYIWKGKELTFEELAKLRLRRVKYDMVRIAVAYLEHPNTSDGGVARSCGRIASMNEDCCYIRCPVYPLEIADKIINHKGTLKNPVRENAVFGVEEMSEPDGTPDYFPYSIPLSDGSMILPGGCIRLRSGIFLNEITVSAHKIAHLLK